MSETLSIIILLLFITHSKGYFDDQPKLITENGNLVLESAKDRNITFRFKGSGCLNFNEHNILNWMGSGGGGTLSNGTQSGNTITKIIQLENRLDDLRSKFMGNRGLITRLSRLENRTRTLSLASINVRIRNTIRRITRLETRVNGLSDQLQQDHCRSNPCQNGGTCLSLFSGFSCKCIDSWTGLTCQEDVNECARFAGSDLGCQNGATCLNSQGGYSCVCQTGWQGIHCTRRNTDCLSAPAGELCGHGICVNTHDQVGFTCFCEQGWKSSGSSSPNGLSRACTIDVDECNDVKPHCSMDPPVRCINIPGSFMCGECPAGYTGNGHYCMDINECEINNGGCSTTPSVPCVNTRGSYNCGICPVGWEGDGKTCVRSTAMTGICSNYPCHPLARCVESSYGAACICPVGYVGQGIGTNGCVAGSMDPCSSYPCQNGGTCNSNGTSFTCTCPAGTIAPVCRQTQDACRSNPCKNGGTCTSRGNAFICRCADAFTGTTCQTELGSCGGVLLNERGHLKYPMSDKYPLNVKCAWLIRTNATQVLNVTFTKFALENSSDCKYDWLQIHDGRTSASHMIGRFCGHELPNHGNIISSNNYLYLWFRSDASFSHDGFELSWESINPICGGEMIIYLHGTISSPGSPGNYPPNRLCDWHLIAPPGKRIQLHFFTMQLEAHDSCAYDYFAIYGGGSTSSPLLEKFCNSTHPEPITSPTNEMALQFYSDQDGSDAGFQIHYSIVDGLPGCGGTYTMNLGEVSSPLLNGVYPKNLMCEYLIKMPKDNKIRISFKLFELESNLNCAYDYLEIYEGTNIQAPKVGRFCGDIIPEDYTSMGNSLLLVFKTDWSSSHKGFRLVYELVCGGYFDTESGIISSPLYPQHYDENRVCEYLIEGPAGKAIKLDFQDLDIESYSHDECDYDFVALYDGYTTNNTLLGKYCGQTHPPQALSTFNQMLLIFQSDASVGGKGFKANYSMVDITCGGVIKKLGQLIKPPMTERQYKTDSECKWIIDAPAGHVVQLSFTSFDLEDYGKCPFDYVAIYEGTEQMGQRIGKYCGHALPPVILSNSNMLTIVFVSDDSISGDGFLITYNFIESKNMCGGNYYTTYGRLRSPGFPNSSYPIDKDCVWIISAPDGKQIELVVNSFQLEDSTSCSFDYIEIRNGANGQSPLIGKYCGTQIPKTIRSFSNNIYIHFKSDASTGDSGFEIEWDATSTGCGGILNTSPRGSITSPNYPQPYSENAQCDWRISVSAGSTIQLALNDMDMEEHGMCLFDSLQIFDGRDTASKSLGKYCSISNLFHLNTSTNHAFLRMQSDISNQGRGFSLNYNINCRREIREHRGVIESPNYPNNYPNNMNCEWTVIAPKGNKIRVHFSAFNLEESNPCSYDYLQIEERNDNEIIRTEKYCDTNIPAPFNTSGEMVIFKFVTDSSHTFPGFHLEFDVQGCGDYLIRPSGEISSPNYPNIYPHSTHCEWTISTDFGTQIQLTFHDFDFEASPTCNSDGLIVANTKNYDHPISQFCGSAHKTPAIITSSSNQLFIKFYSDLNYGGRGFNASYTSVPTNCGGIYKLPKGNIASPNYPMNYNGESYCEWFLETEETHTLSLNFLDFDLEESATCQHDVLKIYDGFEKTDEKLLAKQCGSQIPNRTLSSTGNKMLIVMQTDSGIEAKGFNASFETNCGSYIVTNTSGIIAVGSSVKWITTSCTWVIKAANPGQHVVLTFLKFQNKIIGQILEALNIDYANCFKMISIYDGDNIGAPLREQICGEHHPAAVVSNGDALTIAINTTYNDYNMALGFEFEAEYSVLDNSCGGMSRSLGGTIASPLYPKSYPLNIECIWTIEASSGNRMLFTIEMLDISQSEHCNKDYLEIRKNDESGDLLGLFCGDTIPSILPPVQKLWLKFRSDDDEVGKGFKAQYNYARHVELSGETGIIASPMYPDTAYLTEKQTYRISVKVGHIISMIFDGLLIKFYTSSTLTIYDGYDATAPMLTQLEQMTGESFISSTNVVFIVIDFEGATETKFKLSWTQLTKDQAVTAENATETLNCTKNSIFYVDKEGTEISSPGYPNGYDLNLNCSWTFISAKMGFHPTVIMLGIDLSGDYSDCLVEYVKISASSDLKEFKELAKLCQFDNALNSIYSGTPYLKLQFISAYYRSSDVQNKTGFRGMVGLTCGGPMSGPNGIITKNLTRIDLVKQNVASCEWEVVVRPGRTIQFEFLQLDLRKNSDNTCTAYILIRNGIDEYSPYLGKGQYCGNETGVINETSSSNKAMVKYIPGRRGYTGMFSLSYRELSPECGGSILLSHAMNSTTITSPNYPNIPNAHIECVWTVTAPNGEFIRIDFKDRFDMTSNKNCDQEYVELYDGGTIGGHFIGRYCTKPPDTIKIRSNTVRIKFFTDVVVPKNGFKLVALLSKCGGYYRNSMDGEIKSEGYPGLGAYPSRSVCDYIVQGKVGSTVNFTFTDINLPYPDRDCNDSDHIIFYNVLPATADSNETLDEIGTYCGMEAPNFVIADGPEVLIRFITVESNTRYRGFRISYKSTAERCGGVIIAESGVITSPGYPLGRKVHRFCEWKITVPKGRRIKMNILDLDLAPSFQDMPLRISRGFQQRIGFYNDHVYISRIKFLTVNDSQAPIYSSDNKMLISMWLYTNIGHRGFKFQFTSDEPTICDGNLDGDDGSFFAPPLNSSSFSCEYYRTEQAPLVKDQPEFGSMAIRLTDIAKKESAVCLPRNPSGVYLYFQSSGSSKQFYFDCNNAKNESDTIVTPFPSTRIVIRKYFLTLFTKFRIKYRVHRCGGVISGNRSFIISQPNFTDVTYGEVNCAWQFKTVSGQKVIFNVTHTKFDCENEYINIYNGPDSISPKPNRICGEAENNLTVALASHNAFIEYHSNVLNSASKFQITLQSSYSVCGGLIQPPLFQFRSPLNGTQYPNRVECVWEIKAHRGFHIGLEFIERFFIEQSVNCSKDYVEIFDMINEEWTSLGRVCGRAKPPAFNSTGSQMRMIFRSDDNVVGDGFVIKWREDCGGIFNVTTTSQILTSPHYPDPYPRNVFCNYTLITANPSDHITVKFDDFQMEETGETCRYDNVTIYKYEEYSDPLRMVRVGTYCWADSLTTLRYKRQISIVLRSDAWIEKRGFQLQYSLDQCGGPVTNTTLIAMKFNPSLTESVSGLNCFWNITAPANKTIAIRFQVIGLSNYGRCYSEYVEVYLGNRIDESNLKAKLCSNLTSNLPTIDVDSNKAIVHYKSGYYSSKSEFSFTVLFVTSCTYHIELTENNLSYNINQISDAYASNLECSYKIVAPKGYFVTITFDHFHVLPCSTTLNVSCTCDFVIIYDGPSSFSDIIAGPLCGHTTPKPVMSIDNVISLRFSTDSLGSSSGFSAIATARKTLCGQLHIFLNESKPEIILEAPTLTSSMQVVRCRWLIQADLSENLQIKFEEMNIPCESSSLEFIDENVERIVPEGTGSEIEYYDSQSIKNPYFSTGMHYATAPHKYCGTDRPSDIHTSTSKLLLNYEQMSAEKPSTYKLKIHIHKACDSNYTSLQGRIYSRKSENCQTYITTPENTTISLFFSSFSYSSGYYHDISTDLTLPLEIFDGRPNGKLIQNCYAGSKPDPIFANTNMVILKFNQVNLSYVDYNGLYDITYIATDKGLGCGGQIFNYGGIFASPLYPLNDRNYSDCRWDIRVPENLVVSLRFDVFDVGLKTTCTDNFVQLIEIDEKTGEEKVARQFCGEDQPSPYKGKRNILTVRFKKTTNFSGTGWIAHFMAVDEKADVPNY